MKNSILYIMFACLFVSTGLAAYTYEVYTYDNGSKHLFNEESILIDQQGGMDYLFLNHSSSATVLGTSAFEQGFGGIGHIVLYDSSSLKISDGELVTLAINSNATTTLTGGWIYQIQSYQWVPYTPGRDGVPVPNIKLYYSGNLPTYNTTTDILTGLWGNGSSFSIYLHDVAGYDPVINNIEFIPIPEPATMLLLGLGGLALRKRKA